MEYCDCGRMYRKNADEGLLNIPTIVESNMDRSSEGDDIYRRLQLN